MSAVLPAFSVLSYLAITSTTSGHTTSEFRSILVATGYETYLATVFTDGPSRWHHCWLPIGMGNAELVNTSSIGRWIGLFFPAPSGVVGVDAPWVRLDMRVVHW